MRGACLLLGVAGMELIAWLAVSVHLGQLATFAVVRAAQARVSAPEAAATLLDFGDDEVLPDFMTRDVVHPYLGFVLDRGFQAQPRERRGGPDAVEYGFSLSEPGIFHDPFQDTLVVAVTGGSVAFNLAGGGAESLREAFLGRVPPGITRVRIVNLALPGYKQPQQLMTLNYFTVLGAHFDLVVNLDGVNEVALPVMENMSKGVSPFFPRGWYFRARAFDSPVQVQTGEVTFLRARRAHVAQAFAGRPFRYSMTAGLAWFIVDARCAQGIAAREEALVQTVDSTRSSYVVSGPGFSCQDETEMYQVLARVWARSSLAMAQVASSGGARYVHFLQPNQHVPGSKPMGPAERALAVGKYSPFARHVRLGYPKLVAAGRRLQAEGVCFHDLTGLFQSVEEPVYIDPCCHLNEVGERMLAEAIAALATEDLAAADSSITG